MLAELEIENLAVIAHARIPFSPHLNVFTGETGAGKTTLIRLLLALADPQAGSITLSSANTTQSLPSTFNSQSSTLEVSPQTRSNFVYVPQGNTLFSGTIRDNLLMGNPHATEAEMLQALHTACADFVLSLPDGIDTNLNEQGGGLSEGQAQRIAIARALLRPGHIRNGTTINRKPAQRLHRQNIHLHHTPSGSSRGLRSNYTTLKDALP